MARKPSSVWCSFLARRTEAILEWVTAFSRTSPSFLALERLQEIDPAQLAYESVKPGPGGSVRLMLTPLELRDRLAVPIPPPHRHRHPYYGVLAPHVPLRAAVTALAGRRAETPAAQTPAVAPCAPPPAPASPSAENRASRRRADQSPRGAIRLGPTACPVP